MGRPLLDLAGQQFGSLWPIAPFDKTPSGNVIWFCYCEACDGCAKVSAGNLRSGGTTSCGCQRVKHNASQKGKRHPLYQVWADIKKRCYNVNHLQYKDYGGRGIEMCAEWNASFKSFRDHVLSLPNCPKNAQISGTRTDRYIDRYPNNDGSYEPGNVRWATRTQQQNNLRSNRVIIINGERMSLKAACRKIGKASYDKVRSRIDSGWPLKKSFYTP